MIRLSLLFLAVVFLFRQNCDAQNTVEKKTKTFFLRTNLLSFAELDGGIMLGARYQWNKRFSATLDPTFIFFNLYRNLNNDELHPLGIKVRADLRYHFDRFLGLRGVFIAPELHFKKVSTRKWATFGINCVNQSCNYYQRDIYRELKTETGAILKMGIELPLDKKEKLSMEFYGGLGVKVNRYREKSIPVGGSFFPAEPFRNEFFGISEGNAIPILPASVKLSCRLR